MEIGGDYWKEKFIYRNDVNKPFFHFGEDNELLMSGRTAIDFILQDILKEKSVKIVYFPSYSCNSMIEPFVQRNIKIKFYDVYFDEELKYNININEECDIFFAMNYFRIFFYKYGELY